MNGVILYKGPSNLNKKPIVVIAVNLIRKTKNTKLGDAITTYIISDEINPIQASKSGIDKAICGKCIHRRTDGNSCYVNIAQGPTQVYKSYKRGQYPFLTKSTLSLFKNRFIRLGSYGDPAAVPIGIWDKICKIASNYTGYTHQWRRCSKEYAKYCMASCESIEDRKLAISKGYRTFRTRLANQKLDVGEFICPASNEANNRLKCDGCKACSGRKNSVKAASPCIIVHGLDWKYTNYAKRISLSLV